MKPSLADRQAALIRYLVDPVACDAADGAGLLGADTGIDRGRLKLVGALVLDKREHGLRTTLPRTCAALGDGGAAVIRDFAHRCPPIGLTNFAHVGQFRTYLAGRLADGFPAPPFLRDLLNVEAAAWQVCEPEETVAYLGRIVGPGVAGGSPLRIVSRYEILSCAYDVRGFFEAAAAPAAVPQRDVRLVIAARAGQRRLRMFEVPRTLGDRLADMQRVDGAASGNPPDGDALRTLERMGIVATAP